MPTASVLNRHEAIEEQMERMKRTHLAFCVNVEAVEHLRRPGERIAIPQSAGKQATQGQMEGTEVGVREHAMHEHRCH
jgi:hypothetical protein